jgi:hypothetical protein
MADDRCDPHCNTGGRFYRSSRILGQLKEEAGKQKDLVVICTNPAAAQHPAPLARSTPRQSGLAFNRP